MIAGAQKCATTTLAAWLFESPYIHGHRGDRELSFFINNREYGEGFYKTFLREYKLSDSRRRVIAAKSVDVMCDKLALFRLKQHNPDCVLVVLLRNPVERAYSAYWFARRRGWETSRSFESALRREPQLPPHLLTISERNRQYVNRGFYYKHLLLMEQYFSRHQMRVFLLDDFKRRPEEMYREIHKAIGVTCVDSPPVIPRPMNTSAIPRWDWFARMTTIGIPHPKILRQPMLINAKRAMISKLRSINEIDAPIPPMNDDTRYRLHKIFEEENFALSERLGRDLTNWKI